MRKPVTRRACRWWYDPATVIERVAQIALRWWKRARCPAVRCDRLLARPHFPRASSVTHSEPTRPSPRRLNHCGKYDSYMHMEVVSVSGGAGRCLARGRPYWPTMWSLSGDYRCFQGRRRLHTAHARRRRLSDVHYARVSTNTLATSRGGVSTGKTANVRCVRAFMPNFEFARTCKLDFHAIMKEMQICQDVRVLPARPQPMQWRGRHSVFGGTLPGCLGTGGALRLALEPGRGPWKHHSA